MRTDVSPQIVLDREIAPFAATLLAGAAGASADAPIAEQRRHAAQLRQRWTVGGPAMARRRDGIADTARGPVGFRVHYPSGNDRLPMLVYLHGGGWTFLDIDTHDRVMRELAARSGWAVVGVDYPLAPEAPFPAAIEHCAALVEWLRVEAASLGLDAARLAIAGDSAGANLAIATAMKLRDDDRPPPSALILAYGVYDCDFSRASYRRFGAGDYPLSAERMKFLWSTYVVEAALRRKPLAAPLHGNLVGLPPTRLIIAEADILYDENIELAGRLREAGNATQAVVYLGTCHGFIEATAVAEISRQAVAEAGRWLAAVAAPD
jgi:acetyl esterase